MSVIQPEPEQQDLTGPRFSRRVHVTDPDAAFAELQRENDALQTHIESLESRLLTTEELAYVRNRKAADDNAAWLWKTIKAHAPWISTVLSLCGTAVYWLTNHKITVSSP